MAGLPALTYHIIIPHVGRGGSVSHISTDKVPSISYHHLCVSLFEVEGLACEGRPMCHGHRCTLPRSFSEPQCFVSQTVVLCTEKRLFSDFIPSVFGSGHRQCVSKCCPDNREISNHLYTAGSDNIVRSY
ncbi:hypothetical protein KP79_PYT19041 [Mizuhopecten yessoensis]|uniref:Uncharacterized protein n=1 Tax=Mizuhopecten yessoensis TaxID=6573 RepID=A0A210PVJ1_MIZYE|nr:hypothetical protein KP79_PYT19041 [Mizuhopecten yessoensis]